MDDYLRHTMPGAAASGSGAAAAASYYQSYLSDLWAALVPRLTQLVSRNAAACRTISELLSLKYHCVLFERTMANLGFHTAGLNEMIGVVRRQFSHLLIDQWKYRFEEIFKNDNYTAIRLESASELTPELASYPYCQSAEFTSQPYPRTFVFSPMVPAIYTAIQDYIDASAKFIAAPSADLAWTELEDALNRATNVLFTDCLSGLLNSTIQTAESDLLRLIQLTINLTELEGACEQLQTYLHEHARPKFFSSTSAPVDEEQDNEEVSGSCLCVFTDLQSSDLFHSCPPRPSYAGSRRSNADGISARRSSAFAFPSLRCLALSRLSCSRRDSDLHASQFAD